MSTIDPVLALYAGTSGGHEARWNAGQPVGTPVTITYSFRSFVLPSYTIGTYGTPANSFQTFPETLRAATRAVLHAIESVAGVHFVEQADNADSTLQYGAFAISGAGGLGFYPALDADEKPIGNAGDVWVHNTILAGDLTSEKIEVVLHETMHALGLKHPFEGSPDMQLAQRYDDTRYTAMTYSIYNGTMPALVGALDRPVARVEPGVFDIAALRYLYGPSNVVTAGGDDVYRFDGAPMMRDIVDSAGTDTIDFAASTKAVWLDLHAGATSSPGIWTDADWIANLVAKGQSTSAATAFVHNSSVAPNLYTGIDTLSIAPGTVIENAVGGSANDVLVGNAAGNQLTGNGGNDQLDGDAGFDTAIFHGARSGYTISRAADGSLTVSGIDGTDRLVNLEALQFDNKTIFAVSGGDATIARLYGAAFARAPDAGGLAVQLGAVANGVSAMQIAANFIASAEFVARYGTAPGDLTYATALYRNVLGRDPDPSGLAVQLDALAHGMSRAQMLLAFADSNENKLRVEGDWLLA